MPATSATAPKPVHKSPCPPAFHRLRFLSVIGGFLDGQTFEFAEGLNCLIGARATGKTTALEFIRYALFNLRKEMQRGRVQRAWIPGRKRSGLLHYFPRRQQEAARFFQLIWEAMWERVRPIWEQGRPIWVDRRRADSSGARPITLWTPTTQPALPRGRAPRLPPDAVPDPYGPNAPVASAAPAPSAATGCSPDHLFTARIFAARCSNSSAAERRFVARYKSARFSRLTATSGWSGPRAFSMIASERLKSGSALA